MRLGFVAYLCLGSTIGLVQGISNGNSSEPVTLTVGREGGNKSSPLLYGVMFEVVQI